MASTTTCAQFETGHMDTVHDAQFDYYGKHVATCSSDRLVKIFSVTGNQVNHMADLVGHQGPVWEVSWCHPRHGSLLASCGFDGSIMIWQQNTQGGQWQQIYQTESNDASVNSIAWAPYELGLVVAGARADGQIIIVENTGGTWVTSTIQHAHPVGATGVSWAPVTSSYHVRRLATCGCDSTVKLWVYDEANQMWNQDGAALVGHSDWVRSVEWAPSAGLSATPCLASAGEDGQVIVWKQSGQAEWRQTIVHRFGTPVWKASWSTNGSILSVTDAQQHVSMWKEVSNGVWKEVS
ncbi:hypothetical protein M9434_003521 [Picochlorum sp. BPE23]|nr:hypothetical protein M9434_003521 [Picochlorum sp. BPE23]